MLANLDDPQDKLVPSSAAVRRTKVDRLRHLETWCKDHPFATIEEARAALQAEFGVAMGTKVIADTLRESRAHLEAKQREQALPPPPAPGSVQEQIQALVQMMRAAGIRSVSLTESGDVHVEFKL